VNDAPTFVAGPNPVVPEDAGPQSVSPWATAIDDGDPELTQTLAFQVTGNSNPALFSAAPAVAPDGTLTYTPAADANGVATITLVLVDNGSGVAPNQNTSAPQSFTITVTAVNDAPVNTVPGIQNAGAGLLVFSIANGNAISVFDLDAGAAAIEVGLTVTGGTLSAVVTPGVTIAGQGTATLTLSGPQSLINSALDGLSYTPAGAGTDTLTVTTSDLGNTGAGGPQLDVDAVPILIDEPPTVTLIPANGAVVAAGSHVTFTFSESVAVAAGALTISCTPSGAGYSSPAFATSMGVNVTGGAALTGQAGDSCTVTALSAGVTDLDLIDPPNELDGDGSGDSIDGDVDNFVSTYTVDAAPSVTAVVPADGATQVSTAATITVSFSEPVDISSAGAFSLECGGLPLGFTVTSPAPLPASASSATLTPFGGLPEGANCSFTVFASQVPDSDTIDPPDTMLGNFTSSFSTDVAPTVSSVTPAAGATVGTDATLSVTFSEAVDLATGAFTLDCGGAVTLNASPMLPATGTSSVTLTPASALPEGASCTFTVLASGVTDSDLGDPPDTMAANFVRTFNTDAAPTVTSTVPASGATGQSPTGNITVNFSEPVTFSTLAGAPNTSFDLVCNATATDFTVATASPASSVVIDPVDAQVAARNCTLTIRAAHISDVDAADPPDNLAGDVNVAIEYGGVAVPDSYAVTPHLTLVIDTGVQGGRVTANDLLGAGTIIGFGPIGTCAAAVPNGSNSITTAGGGRVVLQANGAFSYAPPAGLVGNGTAPSPEDGFCYTITGGSTADVAFELANTELVWFVDAAYAGANGPADGTQARPFTTLGAAAAVDSANDTIHLAFNAAPYTGGILLEAGERLIGQGSGSDLATITGIAPIAGSAFPALGGSAPTVTCAVASCIALGTGNSLRGFTLGDAGAAGTKISGTAFGTLTVAELTLNGDGRALGLTNGTLNGNFIDIDVSAGNQQAIGLDAVSGIWSITGAVNIGNVNGTAISILNTPAGGSATFLGGVTVNKTSSGAGVNLTANAAPIDLGGVNITTGAGPALTLDNSSGTVTIASGTVSATGGPALNSSSSALAITLASASSTNSSTQGINLNGISGTVNIAGGSISGSTGTAFLAQGTLGTTSYAGSISKTSAGRLVDIGAGANGTLTLSGSMNCTAACSTGAGNHGLRISGRSGGTITVNGSDKIFRPSPASTNTMWLFENNAGATINVDGVTALGIVGTPLLGTAYDFRGGGTINLNGNMDGRTLGARLIDIDGVTLSGSPGIGGFFSDGALGGGVPSIEITNSAAPAGITFGQPLTLDHDDAGESGGGIRLSNNTGSYSFPSVASIVSTNTVALSASNAGTLSVGATTTGAANNAAGVAVDVRNTTIAAAGIRFTSVNSAGGANGIVVQNTGSTGGFSVLGDGSNAANGSGGTINGATDDSIVLVNTANASIASMNISNNGNTAPGSLAIAESIAGDNAIEADGVNGLTLRGINISNPVGTGMLLLDIAGTSLIDGCTISGVNSANAHAFWLANDATSNTGLTVSNSTIQNSSSVTTAAVVTAGGANTLNVSFTGNTFQNLASQALLVSTGLGGLTNGTINATVNNNTFRNAAGTAENNLALLTAGNGTVNATATGNSFDNIAEEGSIANTSIVRTQNAGGVISATVNNSLIQNIGYTTGGRHAIGMVNEPVVFGAGNTTTVRFNGNTVAPSVAYTGAATGREAFFVDYRDTASAGSVRIANNNFQPATQAGNSQQGIELRFRQTNAQTIPVLLQGNTGNLTTINRMLDVDVEASNTVNLTVQTNTFTNPNATPGFTIDIDTEAGGTPAACFNATGNTLNHGGGANNGTIRIAETAGTLNVVQNNANQVAGANGIPNGNVTVVGTPNFNNPACPLPPP
jgi:large repetitive protein